MKSRPRHAAAVPKFVIERPKDSSPAMARRIVTLVASHCCPACVRLTNLNGRLRTQPLLRPRGALCARRHQCRRRRGAYRGERGCSASALDRGKNAAELAAALGGLKGPIMKVAQLMATIPDLLPPEYVEELQKLQSEAPPMGWAFVKRRMTAELGAGLAGEIRRVRAQAGGRRLARPGASRAVARRQAARLQAPVSRHAVGGRSRPQAARLAVRDPSPHGPGDRHHARSPRRSRARVREELDYRREAKHVALYRAMLERRRSRARAGGLAGALDRAAAHARLARGHQAARATRSAPLADATASGRRCSPPGGCRSAATA